MKELRNERNIQIVILYIDSNIIYFLPEIYGKIALDYYEILIARNKWTDDK
jgi:hypothetical protein